MIVVLLVVRVVGVSANGVSSYVFSWADFWVYGGKETQIIFVKSLCDSINVPVLKTMH